MPLFSGEDRGHYSSGKGVADIVQIPRKNVESPAIVLELKYNKDADTAISQIKRKQYPAKIADIFFYTYRLASNVKMPTL